MVAVVAVVVVVGLGTLDVLLKLLQEFSCFARELWVIFDMY